MKLPLIMLSLWMMCVWPASLCAQTPVINRLKAAVAREADPHKKILALFALCEQRQSLHADTLCHYAQLAASLSRAQANPLLQTTAAFHQAACLVKQGAFDSALSMCDTRMAALAKNSNGNIFLKYSALRAQILVRTNHYKQAMEQFYQLLRVAEKRGDVWFLMTARNGIGWVYMEMNQHRQALAWFRKALQTTGNDEILRNHANVYSNAAEMFKVAGRFDSALHYAQQSIELARRNYNLFHQANGLNILADIYIKQGQAHKAAALLSQAIDIRKQIGDPYYVVSDISQLAILYAHHQQPGKGIALSNEGIAIARQYNLRVKLPFLYSALAQNHRAAGNYQQYGDIMQLVLNLQDSMFATNTAEALAGMESRYNAQMQENIIMRQKLDLVSKNYQLFGSLIIFVLILAIALLLFRDYNRRQQAKLLQVQQAEKRKAREAVLEAEERERRRIAADLHDNMGAYATAISANIDELTRTGRPGDAEALQHIKANATGIMANLRDTIWLLNAHEILLTGVSDRLKTYLKRIGSAYPGTEVRVVEHIKENRALAPEAALNTLRILQEAVHNALRHSKATSVVVEIVSNGHLQIFVRDNGCGIPLHGNNGQGYGLRNMAGRAKANGWQLDIVPDKQGGTVIKIMA